MGLRRLRGGHRLTEPRPAPLTVGTREAAAVIGILLLAMAIRVLWFLSHSMMPAGDTALYASLASRLVETGTFGLDGPGAERPPGWPALLALFLWLGEPRGWNPTLLNVGFGAFSVVLTWALGRLAFGRVVGLIAALAVGVYANHVGLNLTLASEPLFLVLWLAALLTLAMGQRESRMGWFVAGGLLLGLAALVRPAALCLPVALLLGALLRPTFLGQPRARWLVAVGLCALTLMPWAVRNRLQLGAWIPVSTIAGPNLYIGNNDVGIIFYMPLDHPLWDPIENLDEVEADRTATRLAVRQMTHHPIETLSMWPLKARNLLQPELYFLLWHPRWPDHGVWRIWANALGQGLWWFTLLGTALWLALLIGRRGGFRLVEPPSDAQRLLLTAVIAWIAMHLVMWGNARFRHAIEPLMMLFAVAGVGALVPHRPRTDKGG